MGVTMHDVSNRLWSLACAGLGFRYSYDDTGDAVVRGEPLKEREVRVVANVESHQH
jgi:hypothetical protein